MPNITADDRAAITDSIVSFYHLVDSGSASRCAEMFTDDGRLTFGPGSPAPGTVQGADIATAMKAREAQTSAFTRHVVSNVRLEADVDVSANYILTLYRSDDETRSSVPAFVADVHEEWRRDASGWRIAERLITPAFARP